VDPWRRDADRAQPAYGEAGHGHGSRVGVGANVADPWWHLRWLDRGLTSRITRGGGSGGMVMPMVYTIALIDSRDIDKDKEE
jgi:hypothetical protein